MCICCILLSCEENDDESCESCLCLRHGKKWADLFEANHSRDALFDYHQALNCAQETNRPVLLVFTGWGCARMSSVELLLNNESNFDGLSCRFILTILYVDDKVGRYNSGLELGKFNNGLQIDLLRSGSQPAICVLAPDGSVIVPRVPIYNGSEDFRKTLEQVCTMLNQQ